MMLMNAECTAKAVLLRIFMGESDRWKGKTLHEAIAIAAREHGLGGTTVLRGIVGYGAKRVFHSANILDLSMDLPIVVEIVDSESKIHGFLQDVEEMLQNHSLVTLEEIAIYTGHKKK